VDHGAESTDRDVPLRILVVTEAYPHTDKEEFVGTELAYLGGSVKATVFATRPRTPLIETVPPCEDLSQTRASVISLLLSARHFPWSWFLRDITKLFKEASSNRRRLTYGTRVLRRYAYALLVASRVSKILRSTPIDVIYSFWGNAGAIAASMVRGNTPFLVRLHGADLYSERAPFGFIPGHELILRSAQAIVVPSSAAADYIGDRRPSVAARLSVCRLGVPINESTVSKRSGFGATAVSVAYVTDVKRLWLIAEAVAHAANGGIPILWTHIGDGPAMASLRQRVQDLEICQFVTFTGQVRPQDVTARLLDINPDCALNVSSSEGGCPVSLQQALSVGIPIAATAVGGNVEIVNLSNGVLLPELPTPKNIVEAVRLLHSESGDGRKYRQSAAQSAQRMFFSAKRNAACIEARLTELIAAPPPSEI